MIALISYLLEKALRQKCEDGELGRGHSVALQKKIKKGVVIIRWRKGWVTDVQIYPGSIESQSYVIREPLMLHHYICTSRIRGHIQRMYTCTPVLEAGINVLNYCPTCGS